MTIDLDLTLRIECPAQEKWQGITSEYPTAKKAQRVSSKSPCACGTSAFSFANFFAGLGKAQPWAAPGIDGGGFPVSPSTGPSLPPHWMWGWKGWRASPPKWSRSPPSVARLCTTLGEARPSLSCRSPLWGRSPSQAGSCGCFTSWSHPPCEGGLGMFPVCPEQPSLPEWTGLRLWLVLVSVSVPLRVAGCPHRKAAVMGCDNHLGTQEKELQPRPLPPPPVRRYLSPQEGSQGNQETSWQFLQPAGSPFHPSGI